jgi:hypothetical protein
VLSGDADAVTPPAEHHLPIYNGTAAPCRAFVSILEGSHCGYADGGGLCDLGELFFNGLDRPTQTALTIDLLTAWFDFHLKDDEEAWPAFASYDASSPHTATTIDCASDLAAHPTSSLLPAAYPNPFRDVLHLAPCPSLLQSATLYALSSNQVSVLTAAPAFVAPIDWILDPTLPAGAYVLQRMCGTSVTRQVVVKMNCEY